MICNLNDCQAIKRALTFSFSFSWLALILSLPVISWLESLSFPVRSCVDSFSLSTDISRVFMLNFNPFWDSRNWICFKKSSQISATCFRIVLSHSWLRVLSFQQVLWHLVARLLGHSKILQLLVLTQFGKMQFAQTTVIQVLQRTASWKESADLNAPIHFLHMLSF